MSADDRPDVPSASAGSAAERGPHTPRARSGTPRSAPPGGGGSAPPDRPGDPDYVPAPRIRRPRRQRSVTESLLSIVLLLEAIVLFFVVLVFIGLKTVSVAIAFGGGAAFVLVILITIALLRWWAGVAVGWVVQAALIALGILNPVMYVVGVGFTAFWTWCLVRGRQIDTKRRAYLAAHPELADPTPDPITSEGDTL
ncbi:MAG: DUF4233 domain-containing protein [Acidobacteria bacterium]|nr:DUF4233 domain-containing protein [Acidobacteriota bacterium]